PENIQPDGDTYGDRDFTQCGGEQAGGGPDGDILSQVDNPHGCVPAYLWRMGGVNQLDRNQFRVCETMGADGTIWRGLERVGTTSVGYAPTLAGRSPSTIGSS